MERTGARPQALDHVPATVYAAGRLPQVGSVKFSYHPLLIPLWRSPDGAAVTAPISLMEWFVNYYPALQQSGIPYVEATVSAGDLVFVPRGWWHAVLNLDDSIAVTQNYVPTSQLAHTLLFLRDKADQVSGVPRGRLRGGVWGMTFV